MIKKTLGYGVTLAVAAAAGWIVWGEYQHYANDPWTRDGQVRANVVGIAPRVSGPIIRIAVVDNQRVKKGDLLFEIDPADFQAAVEQAKAQLMAAAQAALTQRKQDLERQTALFQKKVNALQDYQDAQDNYDSAQANLAQALKELATEDPGLLNPYFLRVNARGGPSSLFSLAPNPLLDRMAALPIKAPFHSIIGDRGLGGGPRSSDGVVPYSSSHLAGAESEKIVPAGHRVFSNEAAVLEINPNIS